MDEIIVEPEAASKLSVIKSRFSRKAVIIAGATIGLILLGGVAAVLTAPEDADTEDAEESTEMDPADLIL